VMSVGVLAGGRDCDRALVTLVDPLGPAVGLVSTTTGVISLRDLAPFFFFGVAGGGGGRYLGALIPAMLNVWTL
jgi:hypothetical protein